MTNYPPTIINRPKDLPGSKTIKTLLAYIFCFAFTFLAFAPPILNVKLIALIFIIYSYAYLSRIGKKISAKTTIAIGLFFALLMYL